MLQKDPRSSHDLLYSNTFVKSPTKRRSSGQEMKVFFSFIFKDSNNKNSSANIKWTEKKNFKKLLK